MCSLYMSDYCAFLFFPFPHTLHFGLVCRFYMSDHCAVSLFFSSTHIVFQWFGKSCQWIRSSSSRSLPRWPRLSFVNIYLRRSKLYCSQFNNFSFSSSTFSSSRVTESFVYCYEGEYTLRKFSQKSDESKDYKFKQFSTPNPNSGKGRSKNYS